MRLLTVNCILLACIATTLAAENSTRSKRDLNYWKNLISSKLLGTSQDVPTIPIPMETQPVFPPIPTLPESQPVLIREDGDVKIYRIPGFDNILVKAAPKAANVEVSVPAFEKVAALDPTMAIIQSYLGTERIDTTLNALQGVNNLLHSGVLDARHEMVETLPLKETVYVYPQYTPRRFDFFKPRPVAVIKPPKVPLVPVRPPPLPIPTLNPVPILHPVARIGKPIQVPPIMPVPVVPIQPKYSWALKRDDGSVMTYSSRNRNNVIVTETMQPMPPPPPYILDRFQQILMGIPCQPMPIPAHPILPAFPSIALPRPVPLDVPIAPIMPPYNSIYEPPKVVKVNPYPYKQIHDGVVTYGGLGAVRAAPVAVSLKKPVFIPPPPSPYVLKAIENVAVSQMLQKPPAGYAFSIINDGNSHMHSGEMYLPAPHVFPEPFVSKYVQNAPNLSTVLKVDGKQRFDAKINAKVNSGNSRLRFNATPAIVTGGYSYKQVRDDGTLLGPGIETNEPKVLVTESIKTLPSTPLHLVERIEKAATAHAVQLPKVSPGFPYKIVDNPAIGGKVVGRPEPPKGVVMFGEPVPSRYIYKQINHNSPEPFTVVKVEDKPKLEIKGELLKVNIHEHVRPDGTKYPCQLVHDVKLVPVAPKPKPINYVYVPPVKAAEETPLPIKTNIENKELNAAASKFYYKQVTDHGVYEYNNHNDSVEATPIAPKSNETKEQSTTEKPTTVIQSLHNNPIVVPDEQTYSYKQTDKTSISIHGKSEINAISVKMDENKIQDLHKENDRGDIPEVLL